MILAVVASAYGVFPIVFLTGFVLFFGVFMTALFNQ